MASLVVARALDDLVIFSVKIQRINKITSGVSPQNLRFYVTIDSKKFLNKKIMGNRENNVICGYIRATFAGLMSDDILT